MKKRWLTLIAAAAALIALIIVVAVYSHRRPARRRAAAVTQRSAAAKKEARVSEHPLNALPVGEWTARLTELQRSERWDELVAELDATARDHPADYKLHRLDYLHARATLEAGELDDARKQFEQLLAPTEPFRELALYHLAEIDAAKGDDKAAAQWRLQLIRQFPSSQYRDEAIEDQLQWLDEEGSESDLTALRAELYASAPTALRRELDSRLLVRQLQRSPAAATIASAVALLKGNSSDDPSEKVLVALDRPQIIATLPADTLLLMGESAKQHRHFDRSVALLRMASSRVAAAKRDDVNFSIGRSLFGGEKYAEAEAAYIAGANSAIDPKKKSTMFFHASRAAQLRGDDAAAERWMTAAIGVSGTFPATSAALTQRMRTRLKQGRWNEAGADLAAVRTRFAHDHALVEATLAHALALLAKGDAKQADAELASIPAALLEKFETSEVSYWRGRCAEAGGDLAGAANRYAAVLRSAEPTHFAWFARQRLAQPSMTAAVSSLVAARRGTVAAALAKNDSESARVAATDVVLLHPDDASLAALRAIYLRIPRYAALVALEPSSFPSIQPGAPAESRGATLLRLGLFDEATDEIVRRYPLRPLSSAFAQSLALNRAAASKESILAVEILMKSVPPDFVPELLPRAVLELLYPRYFYDVIEGDSKRFNADPRLVVSIMREESRFNPRAKSVAAARGLLQFIITTARDVARAVGVRKLAPDDLYDPRTIIELGAKYIADLLGQFNRNPYRAAAAYNAGPNQTRLWQRMMPAQGDDYFLSSVNFDETKHYVRKVLNSYWRYGEIYEKVNPAGGLRPEP